MKTTSRRKAFWCWIGWHIWESIHWPDRGVDIERCIHCRKIRVSRTGGGGNGENHLPMTPIP